MDTNFRPPLAFSMSSSSDSNATKHAASSGNAPNPNPPSSQDPSSETRPDADAESGEGGSPAEARSLEHTSSLPPDQAVGRTVGVFWTLLLAMGLAQTLVMLAPKPEAASEDHVETWLVALAIVAIVGVALGVNLYELLVRRAVSRHDELGRAFARAAVIRLLGVATPIFFSQICVLVTGELFPYAIFTAILVLLFFAMWPTRKAYDTLTAGH